MSGIADAQVCLVPPRLLHILDPWDILTIATTIDEIYNKEVACIYPAPTDLRLALCGHAKLFGTWYLVFALYECKHYFLGPQRLYPTRY